MAFARDVQYTGNEETVYVRPGEPTQITFPSKIDGGYKKSRSSVTLQRQDNHLILFAQPQLSVDGEAIIVHLDDKRTYALRVAPENPENPRDGFINIVDNREPEIETGTPETQSLKTKDFPPATTVPGLMREMVLVAEFGKSKGITGYRRSNRYTGETVLHDGSVEARIEEIFMGPDLWGYVVSVENLLGTNQRINPATFRLDGTKAISAERWELTAQPLTAEQKISGAHKGKLYIVTRAKRR